MIPLTYFDPDYTAPGGKPGGNQPGSGGRAGVGAGVSTINGVATLYIGGMYEEVLTDPNHAYISYYSFGGKLVGMRRANEPSSNGQYRIVGDHLGSTSLMVDASTSPQVVSRQYYKPYGEVAWSWGIVAMTNITTKGYTGQRVDPSTGLMYYGARLYDSVLAHFVSADWIAPDPLNPRTRQRYSYVVNNPLRYVDPSGHEAENSSNSASSESCDPNDPHPSATCQDRYNQLHEYGVRVAGLWTAEELAWLLDAIHDILNASHWDAQAFRSAVGADPSADKYLTFIRVHGPEDHTYDKDFPGYTFSTNNLIGREWGNGTITVYDLFGMRENLAKRWIVHEIAHTIDSAAGAAASNPGRCRGTGWFSCGMAAYIGASYGNGLYDPGGRRGTPASTWKNESLAEDFAESFTAMVYANNPNVLNADSNIPLHAPDANRQNYIGMIVDYFREHRY